MQQLPLPCATVVILALTLATRLTAQGKNPPGVNPQHYQCYNIPEHPIRQRRVQLKDQFDSTLTVIGNPVLLCNPVAKNYQASRDTTTHLVCYQIAARRAARRTVTVTNQFGTDTLMVDRAQMLCVPSTKQTIKHS